MFLALLALQIPFEEVDPRYRDRVRQIVTSPELVVPIERTPTRSNAEAYDFLLDELPFTASVVRAMGAGRYEIWTEESVATEAAATEEEADLRRRTFYMDDREGLMIRAVRVLKAEQLWVYYTYGVYDLGLVRVRGWSVIVVTYVPREDVLDTEATVYVHVTGFAARGAQSRPELVTRIVSDKSTIFIRAARTVAEAARADPEGLYRAARRARDVDRETLENFRRRFLE